MPPLSGEVARRSRDGEVVSDLWQPLSQPSAASSPGRGALGACKTIKPPREKVQTGKSGLHLLLMATVLRQLVTNLIPPYQAARTKTYVG